MSKFILHPLDSHDTLELKPGIKIQEKVYIPGEKPLLLIDRRFYVQVGYNLYEVASTGKHTKIDIERMAQVLAPGIDDAIAAVLPLLYPRTPEQFPDWFKAIYSDLDKLSGASITLRAARAIQLNQTNLPEFVSDEEVKQELIPFLLSITSGEES